jgi:hypothetical protein
VVENRGHRSGDIELAGYLTNAAGPVSLVMDLHIAHDRVGSSTDPTFNGHLRYPNNLDNPLNDTSTDKIRKYRAVYNNNPPSVVSFMSAFSCTSGRLHREFIRLLSLQAQFRSKCGNLLANTEALRINLNLDGSVFIFRCSSSTTNPVSTRRVDSSVFSLSSHRYSYISLLFVSRFIDS